MPRTACTGSSQPGHDALQHGPLRTKAALEASLSFGSMFGLGAPSAPAPGPAPGGFDPTNVGGFNVSGVGNFAGLAGPPGNVSGVGNFAGLGGPGPGPAAAPAAPVGTLEGLQQTISSWDSVGVATAAPGGFDATNVGGFDVSGVGDFSGLGGGSSDASAGGGGYGGGDIGGGNYGTSSESAGQGGSAGGWW